MIDIQIIKFPFPQAITTRQCKGSHVIQFGDPQPLAEKTVTSLGQRWQPCTLPFIVDRGGEAYAWLVPGELECAL